MPEEINMEARMKAEVHRRAQWKGAIEQELQATVQEAADVRKKITEAKTSYKKSLINFGINLNITSILQGISNSFAICKAASLLKNTNPFFNKTIVCNSPTLRLCF